MAVVLRFAGIPRRASRKDCPVDLDTLRALFRAGSTAAAIAREYQVTPMTAARWFAEAGLTGPDPKATPRQLRQLYVNRQLTTREVAAELGIPRSRVIRALTAAGIPRRPRSQRRPRGNRAAVTDAALTEVYQHQGKTIKQAAKHFGVSTEYLRRRIAETGLTRRPGAFIPRSAWSPQELRAKAVELYATGMNMHHAGAELGVTSTTVSQALHAAKPRSGPSAEPASTRTARRGR